MRNPFKKPLTYEQELEALKLKAEQEAQEAIEEREELLHDRQVELARANNPPKQSNWKGIAIAGIWLSCALLEFSGRVASEGAPNYVDAWTVIFLITFAIIFSPNNK